MLQVDGVSLPVLWGVCTVSCSPVLLPRSLQSGGEGPWGGGSSLGGRSPHHRPLSGQPHQNVHVDLMCITENAVALYVHIHTLLNLLLFEGVCVCRILNQLYLDHIWVICSRKGCIHVALSKCVNVSCSDTRTGVSM